MDAWEEVSDKHERRRLHALYGEKWRFRPDVRVFPGIAEPAPSVTYQISSAFRGNADGYQALLSDLGTQAIKAFRRCTTPDEKIFATDVFHFDFFLRPHEKFAAKDPEAWRVPLFPNGEYSLFVLRNGQMGFFGHPWEQTLCVFGAPLVEAFATHRPKLFRHLVRRDGKKVAEFEPKSRAG